MWNIENVHWIFWLSVWYNLSVREGTLMHMKWDVIRFSNLCAKHFPLYIYFDSVFFYVARDSKQNGYLLHMSTWLVEWVISKSNAVYVEDWIFLLILSYCTALNTTIEDEIKQNEHKIIPTYYKYSKILIFAISLQLISATPRRFVLILLIAYVEITVFALSTHIPAREC